MNRSSPLAAIAATMSIAAAVLATVAWKMPPRLIWNVSASIPLGLYLVRPSPDPQLGELVAAMPPGALASFMATRRYLGVGVPMLKHVAALTGQTVCRSGRRVRIDGVFIASARRVDSLSRALPIWSGCHRVTRNDVFLLNSNVSDSFDGRYFGVLARSTVIGRVVPVWTWKREA
ncbi:S26 family signal peptidase [Sphingosinicellaceae bacterium]|nr:S26 family signal peptidase [Sphingosinicellaceae bacterium]